VGSELFPNFNEFSDPCHRFSERNLNARPESRTSRCDRPEVWIRISSRGGWSIATPGSLTRLAKKSKKPPKAQGRRKKRTREHVIADQSLVHVQYFIANAGFTSEAVNKDYGHDVTVNTFDRDGLIEGGSILIQLKASEVLTHHADGLHFAFDLDMRDYDLWTEEPNPVFLILYEAATRRAYWLFVQSYLKGAGAPKPRANAKTVRIKVPRTNKVRTAFFRHARRLKAEALKIILEAKPYG